jgi:hypothetical protein
VQSGDNGLAQANEEVSYLGHPAPVVAIAFSGDSSLVASAALNGSVRLWDASTGSPRPFTVHAPVSSADQLQFSPDSTKLAINSGRRVWVVNVESGSLLTEIELGELHVAMAFADDEHLYLGSESGTLRLLARDRSGSWNLRNIWSGSSALRKLAVSPRMQKLVLVNAHNAVRLLDIRSGQVSELTLTMPDVVSDILFNKGESRVLLRTPRWVHRATLTGAGLVWLDAIRAPKAMPGSRMVNDLHRNDSGSPIAGQADGLRENDRILMLTRETGFAELAELQFDYSDGPALVGNRQDLLDEWRRKLAIEPEAVPLSDTVPAAAGGT